MVCSTGALRKDFMENKIDLVYILGTGSKWGDNELRFSLRSVEQYLKDFGKVFIIGEQPPWLQKVEHKRAFDRYSVKTQNGVHKIMLAANNPNIGDSFILMNDDFFFLKETKNILPYSRGPLAITIANHQTRGGYYFKTLKQTKAALKSVGIDNPIDFEVHYPVIFEKQKLLELRRMFGKDLNRYQLRTLYGNIFKIEDKPVVDFKANDLVEFAYQKKRQPQLISCSDGLILERDFRDWLRNKFTHASMFEKDQGSGVNKNVFKNNGRMHALADFQFNGIQFRSGDMIPAHLHFELQNAPAFGSFWVKG